jgi:hypothetical protein
MRIRRAEHLPDQSRHRLRDHQRRDRQVKALVSSRARLGRGMLEVNRPAR